MEDRTEIIETTPTPRTTEVRTTGHPAPEVDHVDAVAYDPFQQRRMTAYRVTQLIYLVFGIIEALIFVSEEPISAKTIAELLREEPGAALPSQLALAWCLKNPHVSTVITGASRPSQVKENMQAQQVVPKLSPDVMARIDAIVSA